MGNFALQIHYQIRIFCMNFTADCSINHNNTSHKILFPLLAFTAKNAVPNNQWTWLCQALLEVSMTIIVLWICVCADDWAAELAVKASNVHNKSSVIIHRYRHQHKLYKQQVFCKTKFHMHIDLSRDLGEMEKKLSVVFLGLLLLRICPNVLWYQYSNFSDLLFSNYNDRIFVIIAMVRNGTNVNTDKYWQILADFFF